MGNALGGRKTTKVMKINGEEFKLKTPIQAREVLKDYPGLVLLESESVKHYGTRAKPLEPSQELKPRRLYFLVELPKPDQRSARRVRSGINMSAKDRLESLMLSRRSVSDLSLMKPVSALPAEDSPESGGSGGGVGGVRVKMRLRRAEVERLLKDSKDGADVAEKIVDLCMVKNNNNNNINDNNNNNNNNNNNINNNNVFGDDVNDDNPSVSGLSSISEDEQFQQQNEMDFWRNNVNNDHIRGHVKRTSTTHHQKRVSFRPMNEGEIQIAVA